jgi:arginine-tRNA-protein transferase
MASRSLGTFMILWMIDYAQQHGLPHVYLGYWVDGSEKMSYKARFHPLEVLDKNGWSIMDPTQITNS